jgi:phosphohistidine phosphatase SixA
LICSTAPRAKQGGEILIEKLGIKEVFFARCLWDDSSHYSDWEEVESLINDNLIVGEIIIYMSHLDLVPRIARHVAFKLGHEDGVEWFENSKYAEGWLINSQGTVPFPR